MELAAVTFALFALGGTVWYVVPAQYLRAAFANLLSITGFAVSLALSNGASATTMFFGAIFVIPATYLLRRWLDRY